MEFRSRNTSNKRSSHLSTRSQAKRKQRRSPSPFRTSSNQGGLRLASEPSRINKLLALYLKQYPACASRYDARSSTPSFVESRTATRASFPPEISVRLRGILTYSVQGRVPKIMIPCPLVEELRRDRRSSSHERSTRSCPSSRRILRVDERAVYEMRTPGYCLR